MCNGFFSWFHIKNQPLIIVYGTGPIAGNGSYSQDLLYSPCVILIQSGMLARNLAYGPVAGARWEVKCPVLRNLSIHQHLLKIPFASHHLPLCHCLEQWVQDLRDAKLIKIISYPISGMISGAISFFPDFWPLVGAMMFFTISVQTTTLYMISHPIRRKSFYDVWSILTQKCSLPSW